MAIINYDSYLEPLILRLQKLIQIPSVYDEASCSKKAPFGEKVLAALNYMQEIADEDGLNCVNYDNYVLAINYENKEERIDVIGHLDVVEAGNGWLYDPFSGQIVDNKMYGRGSQDMKTAVMLIYTALRIINDYHLPCKRELRIVLGTDEERTMDDMKYYIHKANEPTFAFTPDGMFPLSIGEKGALMWRLKGKVDTIIESLDAGVQCNVIAPNAKAILKGTHFVERLNELIDIEKMNATVKVEGEQTIIEVIGKAAHASRPSDGHSATYDLLYLISQTTTDVIASNLYEVFHKHDGSGANMKMSLEPMGELTCNLGILRIVDGEVYGEVDARYPYGISSEELTTRLQQVCFVDVSLDYDAIPVLHDINNPFIQSLLKIYQDHTGDYSEPFISGGVTYSKVVNNCVAFGPGKFGMEILAHQANEYVLLDSLKELLILYTEAMLEIANICVEEK